MKQCIKCLENKELVQYYVTGNKVFSKCKDCCKNEVKQKRDKIKQDDGWDRLLSMPGHYNDQNEKEEVFNLMERLGWEYSIDNNLWFKDGIKNNKGEWNLKSKIR